MKASFLLILALVLISSPSSRAEDILSCPECQRTFPLAPKYCPSDGKRLVADRRPQLGCPRCGLVYAHGEVYCPADGLKLTPVTPKARSCSRCGRGFSAGERFCPYDGAAILEHEHEPEPDPKPTAKPGPEVVPPKAADNATRVTAPPERGAEKPAPAVVSASLTSRATESFVVNAGQTTRLPFDVTSPGRVRGRAEFRGGGKVLLLVYGPKSRHHIVRVEGFSPLDFDFNVDPAALANGRSFEVWLVLREGGEALGQLVVDRPFRGDSLEAEPAGAEGPETEPKELPKDLERADPSAVTAAKPEPDSPKVGASGSTEPRAEKKDGAPEGEPQEQLSFAMGAQGSVIKDLVVEKPGRLALSLVFPEDAEVTVVISDADMKRKLAEASGTSPLTLYYQVKPGELKMRVLVTSFSKAPLSGQIRVFKP